MPLFYLSWWVVHPNTGQFHVLWGLCLKEIGNSIFGCFYKTIQEIQKKFKRHNLNSTVVRKRLRSNQRCCVLSGHYFRRLNPTESVKCDHLLLSELHFIEFYFFILWPCQKEYGRSHPSLLLVKMLFHRISQLVEDADIIAEEEIYEILGGERFPVLILLHW